MIERILVTGGTGFLGSHLVGRLARRNCKVTVLSRSGHFCYPQALPAGWQDKVSIVKGDIRDARLVRQLVAEANTIFHKAASVGVERSAEKARQFAETNVGGAATIAQVLRNHRHHVKKVILDSSISVYGEGSYDCASCGSVRPPIRYGNATRSPHSGDKWNPSCPHCLGTLMPAPTPETAERLGESVYAVTKKGQEDLLTSACKFAGVSLGVLRYCTVYGHGQRSYNPYTNFLRRLHAGLPPLVHEDGNQKRDFIFVDDAIDVNLRVLDANLDEHTVLNVGSGSQLTIYDFACTLSKELCKRTRQEPIEPIIDHCLMPGDIRNCWADCDNLHSRFNLKTKTELPDGIAKLVRWYLEHCTRLELPQPGARVRQKRSGCHGPALQPLPQQTYPDRLSVEDKNQ